MPNFHRYKPGPGKRSRKTNIMGTGGFPARVQSPVGDEGPVWARVDVGMDTGANYYYGKSHLFRRFPLGTYKVKV